MNILKVETFVDELDPYEDMCGPIESGAIISSIVPPSCWGPMITPRIKSGHEVSKPVAIKDASPGDAVALTVQSIEVLSAFTSSGTGKRIEGRFIKDPSALAICPTCKTEHPETYLKGTGEQSVKCKTCHSSIIPQVIDNGYTLVFDEGKTIGISVPQEVAHDIAKGVLDDSQLPAQSKQHPVNILAKGDIPHMITRVNPMIGNIGSLPCEVIPSSRNSGDYLKHLVEIEKYKHVTKDDLTDGHMDVNTVVKGSIVIVPVKVPGAGIYFGDVHSVQGNGELAGHTADITAEVTMQADVIKGLTIEGPVIIPPINALPVEFRPVTENEFTLSKQLARQYNFIIEEKLYPVQFIGSGNDLHAGIESAIERASNLTGLSEQELKSRGTVTGSVDIGRTSGVVYITMMLPESILRDCQLMPYIDKQFNR